MSLLEEIQQAAVDSNSDMGALLRKCKLLASGFGSKPLEDWLLWESNGYPKNEPVPAYRVSKLQLKGNFLGALGAAINNTTIPMACVPLESRKYYEQYENRNSIAAIQQMLKKVEDGDGTLSVNTSDLALVLGQKVYRGYTCMQAWAEVEQGHLIEVLNSVRNRILDFSLAVSKERPQAGQSTKKNKGLQSARVTQIFNTTVYGGAANLVGSADNSTISFAIAAGDFKALARALREERVAQPDVDELKNIVTEKPIGKSFGPLVSAWLGRMMQKAADGSWAVGITVAGTILSEALARYYGIGN